MIRSVAHALALLLLAGCGRNTDNDAISMSVIGGSPGAVSGTKSATNNRLALMLGATAQGLVSFDAAGRVEPALAERWILTDDGRSLIFRIRRALWSDGRPVTAKDVASALSRAVTINNRTNRNFAAVRQIIAMTGQVIEIRLTSTQPTLLQLLAQPEMAIFRGSPAVGTGPFRLHSVRDDVTRLRLIAPFADGDEPVVNERDDVRIRTENAARAAVRFLSGDVSLVIGGTFNDLPYARAAKVNAADFRVDPAYGLFGLAVVGPGGMLTDNEVRRALAMAIDREALVARFGVNNWKPVYAVLPAPMEGDLAPAALDWVRLSVADRVLRARAIIAQSPALPVLRVALPDSPGARMLFAAIAGDWKAIGVVATAVPIGAPADLRLIDEVAPQSSALWYFDRLSCARKLVCSDPADAALIAAIGAPTMADRAKAIAAADAAYAVHQGYIPLALPLRWSLVAPALTGWQPSAFAIHPLTQLRAAPTR